MASQKVRGFGRIYDKAQLLCSTDTQSRMLLSEPPVSDGYVLTSDSTKTTGVVWSSPGALSTTEICTTQLLADANYVAVSANDVVSVIAEDEVNGQNGRIVRGFGHPADILLAWDAHATGGYTWELNVNLGGTSGLPAAIVTFRSRANWYVQVAWWRNGYNKLPIISDPFFIETDNNAIWRPYSGIEANYFVCSQFSDQGFFLRAFSVSLSGSNIIITQTDNNDYTVSGDSAFTVGATTAVKAGGNIPGTDYYSFAVYNTPGSLGGSIEYVTILQSGGLLSRNGGAGARTTMPVAEFTQLSEETSGFVGLSHDGGESNNPIVLLFGSDQTISPGNPRKTIAIVGLGGTTAATPGTYPSVTTGFAGQGLYYNTTAGSDTSVPSSRLGSTAAYWYVQFSDAAAGDDGTTRFGIVNYTRGGAGLGSGTYQSTPLSTSTTTNFTNLPLFLYDSRTSSRQQIGIRTGSFQSNIDARRLSSIANMGNGSPNIYNIGGQPSTSGMLINTDYTEGHVLTTRTYEDGNFLRMYFGEMQFRRTSSSNGAFITNHTTASTPLSGFNALNPLNIENGDELKFITSTNEPIYLTNDFIYDHISRGVGGIHVNSVTGHAIIPSSSSPPSPMSSNKVVFHVLRGRVPCGISLTSTTSTAATVNVTMFGLHSNPGHGLPSCSAIVAHGDGTVNTNNCYRYANSVGIHRLNVDIAPGTMTAVREFYDPVIIGFVRSSTEWYVK